MRRIFFVISLMLLLSGCVKKNAFVNPGDSTFGEKHLKNITQLTFDGDNGEAYFSPDGKKLIWQSNRGGYACDKIWIMNIDGSNKHMVSPDHGAHTCSFFLPDNKRIVFSSTSHIPGDCPPKTEMPEAAGHVWPLYPYEIFIAGIDGSDMKKITDNPQYDAEPIVSHDGGQIVFGSQRYGDFDVYIMDSDGSNVRRLTDRVGYDGGPWFSPDGGKIAYRAWYPETEEEKALWRDCMANNYIVPVPLDLWVMDSDGSNKRMILHNGATNFAPSWYPDGKRLVFSSNMDDWHKDIKRYGHNFELYIINIDGTGLERLTFNRAFDGFPMFSPDGKKLAFASNRNPDKPRATDIFIADWVEGHGETIHHDLKVVIHPQEHRFTAEDRITVPENFLPEFRFFLHKGLNPSSVTEGVKIVKEPGGNGDVLFEPFKADLPSGVNIFVVEYGGIIDHPVEQFGIEQARGYSHNPGIITAEGVYLEGNSFWYPVIRGSFITFTLGIELPQGWDAVSQGERTDHSKDASGTTVRWDSSEPQEEIYLVAAKFHEYTMSGENVLAMAFLRTPDKGLAAKYLDATSRYIFMYDKLIGPYPYGKFALVENFWETGFGMPSFTLLGPRVIRFPFIIDSSYPHEILHNWWGNGVFPDYKEGNWSEGLTAYLSDHLIKEQRGEGAEYRLTTLQKYADYVFSGRDFPLTTFRSRHSSSSEAVGYGKSMMFFHMLRLELGDTVFTEGLRDFYQKNKFRYATFSNLQKSFERVSGKSLQTEFDQWITHTGAPELTISDVNVIKQDDRYSVTAIIEQEQSGTTYRLRIPVAVTLDGREEAFQTGVDVKEKKQAVMLSLPARPLRIDVDPEFDLFRRLGREEIPPAISQALGAKRLLVVLPSSEGEELLQAYRELAGILGKSGPDAIDIRLDSEITQLSPDQSAAVLGFKNRFMQDVLKILSEFEITAGREKVKIGKTEIPIENHSFVLTASNPENREMAIMLIASDRPESLSGLGRKLPHYHKYSYLAFEGDEPANIAKGRLPVLNSPMTIFIPSETGRIAKVETGKLRHRKPLAVMQSGFSQERMMETIRFLAGDELRGRGSGTEEIDMAAEYIAGKFREAGLLPAGDGEGSYFQTWEDQDSDNPEHKIRLKNVIGVIAGEKPEWAKQSVVIGAHYDHLGSGSVGALRENKGKIHYGADDNASGVAALIEVARVFGSNANPGRNIVFAAFTGEETGKKGSKYYTANQKRYPAEQSVGMLNLDTVGRMQNNRLFILGAGSAKEWVHILGGAGYIAGVDIESVSEELDSSDQISFQAAGIPAVQFFTGPHEDYHRPTDTMNKINSAGLAKVASVAKEVVEYLAHREQPLTVTAESVLQTGPETKKERKVTFGIIPDFAYKGKGCRLDGVVRGSPAEKAGLAKGDVLIKMNSKTVDSLKDLSGILKSLRPGDRVEITYMREGREMTAISGVIGR